MLYFIPAWYTKNEWKENEQPWHSRHSQSETDDTVKQVQLFHRNSICEYRILLLSCAPNLRHFLHRQGLFRANYWSVFDAIQEVKKTKQGITSFLDLNWPKNIEFLYSQFSVVAMLNDKKYAQIEFGEYGNMIYVDLYKEDKLFRKNVYDDRGFISYSTFYEKGIKKYDQYLNENGIWKLCHFTDGKVSINPRNNKYFLNNKEHTFNKLEYSSLEYVIKEVLDEYLKETEDGIFCVAAHKQQLNIINDVLKNKKTVLSIFSNRECDLKKINNISCVIADSKDNFDSISKKVVNRNIKVFNIPPYDTRIDYSKSLQIRVQNILLPIDSISIEKFNSIIIKLANYYLNNNKDARFHIFTRNTSIDCEQTLLKHIRSILKENGYPIEWAKKQDNEKLENILEDEEPTLFFIEQCLNDISVNKCMRKQRILLDLADAPDLFLQISCVSFGIPQILSCETQYMLNGENGLVNKDISKIDEDLSYYLDDLTNWNYAAISSRKIGKEHTSDNLISQWKDVIDYVERN